MFPYKSFQFIRVRMRMFTKVPAFLSHCPTWRQSVQQMQQRIHYKHAYGFLLQKYQHFLTVTWPRITWPGNSVFIKTITICDVNDKFIRKCKTTNRGVNWKPGSVSTFKCDDLSALKHLCMGALHHTTLSLVQFQHSGMLTFLHLKHSDMGSYHPKHFLHLRHSGMGPNHCK